MIRKIITLCIILSLSACSTTQAIEAGQLQDGNKVDVSTYDGRKGVVKVLSRNQRGFVASDGEFYRYSNIGSLKRETFSPGKTTALVGGSILGVGALLVASVLALLAFAPLGGVPHC